MTILKDVEKRSIFSYFNKSKGVFSNEHTGLVKAAACDKQADLCLYEEDRIFREVMAKAKVFSLGDLRNFADFVTDNNIDTGVVDMNLLSLIVSDPYLQGDFDAVFDDKGLFGTMGPFCMFSPHLDSRRLIPPLCASLLSGPLSVKRSRFMNKIGQEFSYELTISYNDVYTVR